MVRIKDLDKGFGYALRINSALEARGLSKSRMCKESDMRRVGCLVRGLGVLCGVRFSFLSKEVGEKEKGDICERRRICVSRSTAG